MKKLTAALLAVVSALNLCACGSIYDRDYLVIEDYIPTEQQNTESSGITASRYSELKSIIQRLVMSGEEKGSIILDANYSGDPAEDLASACWELRTQNPLCAYCVENISYELSQIVTYYEVRLNISYADSALKVTDIKHISYAYEIKELISEAMENTVGHFAVLCESGYYSAEDVTAVVEDCYRAAPLNAMRMPKSDVSIYSGTNSQKLYEISIDYGANHEMIDYSKALVRELDIRSALYTEDKSEGRRAYEACTYLMRNCIYDPNGGSTAYDMLLNGAGNAEAAALAFVELCRELDLNAQVVYGSFNWSEHCWNIVEIDGEFYHVDPVGAIVGGIENGFLFSDKELWGSYRWDTASYPKCRGALTLTEILENSEN